MLEPLDRRDRLDALGQRLEPIDALLQAREVGVRAVDTGDWREPDGSDQRSSARRTFDVDMSGLRS
jgi:hypothetical protein